MGRGKRLFVACVHVCACVLMWGDWQAPSRPGPSLPCLTDAHTHPQKHQGTAFLVDGFSYTSAKCQHYFLTHFHRCMLCVLTCIAACCWPDAMRFDSIRLNGGSINPFVH